MQVIDSPGVNDPRMDWLSWIGKLNAWLTDCNGYERIIWVIKPAVRPEDKHTVVHDLIMKMMGYDPGVFKKRVTVVFTFCDSQPMQQATAQ